MDEWPNISPEERSDQIARNQLWLEIAKRSRTAVSTTIRVTEVRREHELVVTRRGVGPILNDGGEEFFVFDFHVDDQWGKYLAVVRAPLDGAFLPKFDWSRPITLRIDSGCETGQLLHDVTCECRDQMHEALRLIAARGQGLLLSIPRQDGRGLGLPFKLATLILQKELGFDTVRASAHLDPAGDRDHRTYGGAIAVLRALGIDPSSKLVLLSNNHHKAAVFAENGYSIEMEDINVGHTDANRHHLRAKRDELGHEGLEPGIP